MATRTFVYVTSAGDGDIAVFAIDAASGALSPLQRVPVGPSVMPLAISPDRRFLYAGVRSTPYRVAAFAIDGRRGTLAPVGEAPLPDNMAYLTTDRAGRFLLSASYANDVLACQPIGPGGAVGADVLQLLRFGRHAHAVVVDPDNRFAFLTNLGSDQVVQLAFDPVQGALAPNRPEAVRLPPGAGPRHLCFSPDGAWLFVLGEMNGHVTAFALDRASGRLSQRGSMLAVPRDARLVPGKARAPVGAVAGGPPAAADPAPAPQIWAADLRLTPDGRFLYASERTTSTITLLRVDPRTAAMEYQTSWPTETQPRSIAIDPSGRWLLVAGEISGRLSVYRIDADNGALEPAARVDVGANPAWVEAVAFG